MTDRTVATPFLPVGHSGVVHFSGVLHRVDEFERAWRGKQRDRTIAAMLVDPVIGAVMHGVEMMLRRVDWSIQPADETPEATDLAEFLESALDDMDGVWPGDTIGAMASYFGPGFSVLEIIYKRRDGYHPDDKTRDSRHDDGKIGWRKWALRPWQTRYGWQFDDAGEPIALIQQDPATSRMIDIPLDRCLYTRYSGKTNDPDGSTPLRTAYSAWYNKINIERLEAIGIERDLAGLPVGRLPSEHISGNTAEYTAMVNAVTNIRNDEQAALVLPSDIEEGHYIQDVTLLSTGGQRAFDTNQIVRRYANELVTVFLANVIRTGQDGTGSYALSETQNELFQQAMGAHLDIMSDTINSQAIPRLMRLNGMTNPDMWPRIQHANLESVDLTKFGLYLVRLANTGLLADSPELRTFVHEVAGVPVTMALTQEDIDAQRAEWMAARGSGGEPEPGA